MKKILDRAGFTLIELMIVIMIIALLSMIAIPTFLTAQTKAKQSEAKATLGGIFTAEEAYYADRSVFIEDITKTGGFVVEGKALYDYTVTTPNGLTPGPVGGTSISSMTYPPNAWFGRCGDPVSGLGDGPPNDVTVSYNDIPGVTLDGQAFWAVAEGRVTTGMTCDAWEISNAGALTAVLDESR